MKPPLALCAMAIVGIFPIPHQFEDGFVERTMAIVVRGDTAYVEYSVGLNQATLERVLATWERESESDSSSSTANPAVPKGSNSHNDSGPTTTPQSGPLANGAGFDNQFAQTPGESSAANDIAEPAPHFIAPELLTRFKTLAKTEIPKRLVTTLDGNPVKLRNVSEGVAPRHPFTFQLKFQFEVPETKSSELKIKDSNFGEQTGAVRYALKASRDAFLLQSNVAPILVRSERVELKNLSKPERALQTLIEAKLAIVRSNKD